MIGVLASRLDKEAQALVAGWSAAGAGTALGGGSLQPGLGL